MPSSSSLDSLDALFPSLISPVVGDPREVIGGEEVVEAGVGGALDAREDHGVGGVAEDEVVDAELGAPRDEPLARPLEVEHPVGEHLHGGVLKQFLSGFHSNALSAVGWVVPYSIASSLSLITE